MKSRDEIAKGLRVSWGYIKERPNPTAPPKAIAMANIIVAISFLTEGKKPQYKNAGIFCGECDSYIRTCDTFCASCGTKIDWERK